MDQKEGQIEKYKAAVELIKYYNDNLRRSISDFILAHTILFAFILTKNFDAQTVRPNGMFFWVSFFGFVLCLFWYGNCARFRSHRDLRFAQARAAEPEGWNLISGAGKNFSSGKQVVVGGEKIKMSLPGRLVDKIDIFILCLGFAVIYLIIMFQNRAAVL